MAVSTTWCRHALAAATIAITALALAACGGKNNASGSSTSGGDSSIGSAPSSSSTPDTAGAGGAGNGGGAGSGGGGGGTTPVTGGGGGNGGANVAPAYPKDAKGYVQELLKAMAQPDYARVSQLAVQSAVQQIKDSINGNGGNPNSQWPYLNCVTGTGPNQSTCVARNSHGDELTVKLNQLQLGFPTAVTEALLSRTTYPAAPTDYVNALLSAYEEGNQQRMVRLSNDTVKSKITCTFGKQTGSTPIDGTYSKVTVNGLGVDLGKMYEFKVLTNPGGKANAVKEVLSKQC